MGGCATKPKVLKDDDEKPIPPPPVPPPTEKVEEKDVAVAPVDSSTSKNFSLSNLFDKETEGPTKICPGSENVNASDTTFQDNSQEAGTSKSMESLEKFPAPSVDALTEKIASQHSRIKPEDYTDAVEKLPASAMPVVAPAEKVAVDTHAQTDNIKQAGEEKKLAGDVLEVTSVPDIVTDAPTEKIASQGSVIIHDEYTDALEKYPAAPAVVRVADAPIEKVAIENTKQTEKEKPAAAEAIQNLKQTEEVKSGAVHDQKLEEIADVAKEKKPVNTEDKKMLEENVVAMEKQIEIVDSIIATQESDKKEVKSDVPVGIK